MPTLSLLHRSTIRTVVLLCGVLLPASAQEAGSVLIARLSHDYPLSHSTLNAKGSLSLLPGAVFTLRRGGFLGYAAASQRYEEICPVVVRSGAVQGDSSALCRPAGKGESRLLRAGERVCLTAIESSSEKSTVSLHLVSCGAGTSLAGSFYALARVHLPPGTVNVANLGRIEAAIGELLTRTPTAQATESADKSHEAPSATPAKKLTTRQSAQAESASAVLTLPGGIRKGMSSDELREQLGEPLKMVVLGKKQIWIYPKLKVTLIDGKADSSAEVEAPATPDAAPAAAPELPAAAATTTETQTPAASTPPATPEAPTQTPATTMAPLSVPPPPPADEAPASANPEPPATQATTPAVTPAATQPEAPTTALPGGVHRGESIEDVKAALGEADKIVELGHKTILIYPGHLRVILIDGKVDGAEQQESEP